MCHMGNECRTPCKHARAPSAVDSVMHETAVGSVMVLEIGYYFFVHSILVVKSKSDFEILRYKQSRHHKHSRQMRSCRDVASRRQT